LIFKAAAMPQPASAHRPQRRPAGRPDQSRPEFNRTRAELQGAAERGGAAKCAAYRATSPR